MSNFNSVSITDLIEMDPIGYDTEVFNIVYNTPDYNMYDKIINNVLEYLSKNNKEYWSELDTATSMIEAIISDVAFEQGFKTAVKLIFSSLS